MDVWLFGLRLASNLCAVVLCASVFAWMGFPGSCIQHSAGSDNPPPTSLSDLILDRTVFIKDVQDNNQHPTKRNNYSIQKIKIFQTNLNQGIFLNKSSLMFW